VGVDGELSNGQQLFPVVMLGVDKVPKHLLELPIGTLSLSISLGVVCGGQVELGTQKLKKTSPKLGQKPSVSVAHNDLRDSMVLEHSVKEDTG
jgi:hypothetical protein